MSPMMPRALAQRELAVLRATLCRAATLTLAPEALEHLEDLRVIGGCSCGCESIDFVEYDLEQRSRPIANGIGTTPAGGDVGIIVWGTADAVTSLEVYDLGAGDSDIRLPVEASIRPLPANDESPR
jgi:hypothetical protein